MRSWARTSRSDRSRSSATDASSPTTAPSRRTRFSNATQLAGHVTVEEKAILSGVSAVHQFALIGKYSFIGGCSRVAKDVPPYVKAVGNPVKLYGLNTVGLQRNGFPDDVVRELKRA